MSNCEFCNQDWCWHCKDCGQKSTVLHGKRCDDCHAQTIPGNFVCKECGEHYHPSMTGAKLRPDLCFGCNFWMEKVEWSLDPQEAPYCIRVNGAHYNVGAINPKNFRGFAGYGGTQFNIKTFDGRYFSTRNMWHQGDIPEHFKDRLPDNAEFVSEFISEETDDVGTTDVSKRFS